MSHGISLIEIDDILDLLSCGVENAPLVVIVCHLGLMPSFGELSFRIIAGGVHLSTS